MTKNRYDRNRPCYVDKTIASAERKLAELHIRRQIFAINQDLKALERINKLYPPQWATDQEPSAVHSGTIL
jgi:hypothetical protein